MRIRNTVIVIILYDIDLLFFKKYAKRSCVSVDLRVHFLLGGGGTNTYSLMASSNRWRPKAIRSASFYGESAASSTSNHGGSSPLVNSLVPLSFGAMRAKRPRLFRHTFPLQRHAFEYADGAVDPDAPESEQQYVRVFSYQAPGTGKRRFLAFKGDLVDFVAKYLSIPPLERHFYEIIRHGTPCRAYLDLEYAKECNLNVDGDALTNAIIDSMSKRMKKVYRVDAALQNFIVLDSSTSTKFSRHVILNHPGAIFLDNSHVGAFVRSCVADAGKALWVRKKSTQSETCCFVDLAVYTKNRAFRMYLSSKQGRASVLEPGPFNKFPFNDATTAGVAVFLEQSLVAVPAADVWDCIVASENEAPSAKELEHQFGTGAPPQQRFSAPHCARAPAGSKAQRANAAPSPFPLIDEQVCRIATAAIAYPRARIRSWTLDEEASRLRLDIAANRYCHNVARAHKSNHVYYVVDLAKRTVRQKCLDPDCAGFASTSWRLEDAPSLSSASSSESGKNLKGALEQLMRVRDLRK